MMTAALVPAMRAIQRPSDPQDNAISPGPSGFLSLNILFKEKQGRLCKTNCREIEVALLYPASAFPCTPSENSEDPFDVEGATELELGEKKSSWKTETLGPQHPAAMLAADQEQPAVEIETSLTPSTSSRGEHPLRNATNSITALAPTQSESTLEEAKTQDEELFFPLLSLPLELRLKIYAYLLPARHHKIVTQLPHNGFFYNTSTIPTHSAQSFYPFGTNPPQANGSKNNLTTYKVLTSNFRSSYPAPSIHPEILRVSKQVREEAEPVLYAGKGVVWDFGVHLEALEAFWGDRSREARALVRNVRVAREIPALAPAVAPALENESGNDGVGGVEGEGVVSSERQVDPRWVGFCEFVRAELTGLRSLDLTVWSSSGSTASFPVSGSGAGAGAAGGDGDGDEGVEKKVQEQELRRWREWEWTHDLLQMGALRQARITWWGFEGMKGENGESSFDSWLAGRMVGDRVVRERMLREGVVEEGVVVLRGLGN